MRLAINLSNEFAAAIRCYAALVLAFLCGLSACDSPDTQERTAPEAEAAPASAEAPETAIAPSDVKTLKDLARFAVGGVKRFAINEARTPLPDDPFLTPARSGELREVNLTQFKGKLILINIWATWCAPCVEEMPALDALEKAAGGPLFAVWPISMDRGGPPAVAEFYNDNGISALPLANDPTGRLAETVGAIGLPLTLLVGPDGREMGRFVGPAEWAAPEAQALIAAAVELAKTEGLYP
ncbi:MAG: TlpA disulfide reductase family protein [Pseudomonadota bacterium]